MSLQVDRWRKKPVVIDAVKFTGPDGNGDEIVGWILEHGVDVGGEGREMLIHTLEGPHWARPGDWIIRGIDGEIYPVKDHIFRATYDRAES